MSIYGDMGNIITLKYKLQKLGYNVVYQTMEIGEILPEQTDFYFLGGGADLSQMEIFEDLLTKKDLLLAELENFTPMLAICGGYQLLGESFVTGDKKQIEGLGLLPIKTVSPDVSVKSRCIGNLVERCLIKGLEKVNLVGFENHGGQTKVLNKTDKIFGYLGKVMAGHGNIYKGEYEGIVYKNVVGTYLHGSCLPKNPELTNYLIAKAVDAKSKKDGVLYTVDFGLLDDSLEKELNNSLVNRFVK